VVQQQQSATQKTILSIQPIESTKCSKLSSNPKSNIFYLQDQCLRLVTVTNATPPILFQPTPKQYNKSNHYINNSLALSTILNMEK
tara:strand:- start:718 stop:975 length:258 start_codon:yes stop_codon:yes gene_type:complete